MRSSKIERKTKETQIYVSLNLDGCGESKIKTGLPFLNHMLEILAKHSSFDLKIEAKGDLEVDSHHTIEDIGICLGQALRKALGNKEGIQRFGYSIVPMDEALALVAVDISGRPHLSYEVKLPQEVVGSFETTLLVEFLHSFVNHSGATLHIRLLAGINTHHMIESIFKGLAKALEMAVQKRGNQNKIPSTKGLIE